jgi:hypothetical protein
MRFRCGNASRRATHDSQTPPIQMFESMKPTNDLRSHAGHSVKPTSIEETHASDELAATGGCTACRTGTLSAGRPPGTGRKHASGLTVNESPKPERHVCGHLRSLVLVVALGNTVGCAAGILVCTTSRTGTTTDGTGPKSEPIVCT